MEQKAAPILDRFPLGIQSSDDLRKIDAIYVDKTDYVYKLVGSKTKSYFLARPRRFGKSLLCTTLRAFFEGRKELFEGLKISQWEKNWTKYPVFYLPLASGDFSKENAIRDRFSNALEAYGKAYGVEITNQKLTLAERFGAVVAEIKHKTGLGTVFIVDEYDNPLITSEHLDEDKKTYREFFSVLKDYDEFFRFVFLTGVTKYAKTTVFSGNNQPEDISMDANFSSVCGITHDELLSYFRDNIQAFAQKRNVSFDAMVDLLIKWYDCYLFHEDGTKVLNPVSLFNALKKKDLQNYWYGTGTPTVLMKRIKNSSLDITKLKNDVEYSKDELKDYKDDDIFTELVPLLYYTGYLTIKEYVDDERLYILGFPNYEVESSFSKSLAKEFYGPSESPTGFSYAKFLKDFRNQDINSVMERLKTLYCALPYANNPKIQFVERDFQNVIYLVFSILGEFVISEPHFSKGRADVILINKEFVYIFEFKVDQDAQTALNQINVKNYAGSYNMDGRKIFKIGANFSSKEKNLTDWIVDEV